MLSLLPSPHLQLPSSLPYDHGLLAEQPRNTSKNENAAHLAQCRKKKHLNEDWRSHAFPGLVAHQSLQMEKDNLRGFSVPLSNLAPVTYSCSSSELVSQENQSSAHSLLCAVTEYEEKVTFTV